MLKDILFVSIHREKIYIVVCKPSQEVSVAESGNLKYHWSAKVILDVQVESGFIEPSDAVQIVLNGQKVKYRFADGIPRVGKRRRALENVLSAGKILQIDEVPQVVP